MRINQRGFVEFLFQNEATPRAQRLLSITDHIFKIFDTLTSSIFRELVSKMDSILQQQKRENPSLCSLFSRWNINSLFYSLTDFLESSQTQLEPKENTSLPNLHHDRIKQTYPTKSIGEDHR